MEEPSSKLDHLHLPRPDDGSAGTPTFATWAGKEETGNLAGKDTEMTFEGDENFDDESLSEHAGRSGFNAVPALDRYAPLPRPVIANLRHARSASITKDKPHRPSSWYASRRAKGLQPPAMAIPLKHNRFADFKPWTGDGPEDVLNETVIRTGLAEKQAASSSSDPNVTRPNLAPLMRSKGGLTMLSMLLVQVLDKRQALGKCTAPSKFKPPPRVTLTDGKRESWLRDLASPDVPLRRLSRSIPHGIRDKVLLEQCFAKNVPLARIIWLVKCVGANEIRAFHRKGISASAALAGELKWIRSWTICVEQFVAGIASNCGQDGWKVQVRSAVRLTAALFTEDLLDRQHYIDWLIESFATSSVDMLPFWLLNTALFWRHIVKLQRRGQAFTEAIVAQLGTLANHPTHASSEALRSSLTQYLIRMTSQHPSCIVGIKSWQRTRSALLQAREHIGNHHMRTSIDDAIKRNDLLDPAQDRTGSISKPSRLVIFEYLDNISADAAIALTVQECLGIMPNRTHLTTALLDWASSVHRAGDYRMYLTVRLLTALAANGNQLDTGILDALSETESALVRDQTVFARIVGELASQGLFNYTKYLQWLISTGAAWRQDQGAMALLFAVPLTSISSQGISLRNAILSRLGVSTAAPAELALVQAQLEDLLSGTIQHDSQQPDELKGRILALPPCYRRVVCKKLVDHMTEAVEESLIDKRPLDLSMWQFSVLRNILEGASEMRLLSELLESLCRAATTSLFADLATTVEQHAKLFVAMGSLDNILQNLSQAYVHARQGNDLDQMSIRSMIAVCNAQTKTAGHVHKLEHDLAMTEQQHAASVCSPASDSILTVQNGQINSDEDIDIMLASGNTMDEQMLARLFSAIVERTVKWTMTGSVELRNPSRWFRLLRAFDNMTFDKHMNMLISKLVVNPGSDQVRAILIALVASGCLKLDNTLSALERRLDNLESTSAPQLARFALGVLQTFMPSTDLDRHSRQLEIYRFRIAQRDVCQQNRQAILRFIWHALAAPADASGLLFTESTQSWLLKCQIAEPAVFQLRLNIMDTTPGHRAVQLNKLITEMCVGVCSNADATNAGGLGLDAMIASSCELRLPFLQLLLRRLALLPVDSQERPNVLEPLQAAIKAGNTLWPQLIDCVGADIAAVLRQDSCSTVVRQVEAFVSGEEERFDSLAVHGALEVVSITSRQATNEDLNVLATVADLLQSLAKRVDESGNTGPVESSVLACIGSLLRLLISISPIIKADKITLAPAFTVLNAACALATHRQLQTCSISTLLFDSITFMLRDTPSDMLPALHRRLSPAFSSDPRLLSIFAIEALQRPFALASRVTTPAPVATPGASGLNIAAATSPTAPQTPGPRPRGAASAGRASQAQELKYAPFQMRSWELMHVPPSNTGENDASLSLGLFAARRVY